MVLVIRNSYTKDLKTDTHFFGVVFAEKKRSKLSRRPLKLHRYKCEVSESFAELWNSPSKGLSSKCRKVFTLALRSLCVYWCYMGVNRVKHFWLVAVLQVIIQEKNTIFLEQVCVRILRPIYTVRFCRMQPLYNSLTTLFRPRLSQGFKTCFKILQLFLCRKCVIRRLHATKSHRVNRPLDFLQFSHGRAE